MSVDLALYFVLEHAAADEKNPPFFMGDPMEAVELMWPMLELFQGEEKRSLRALPYDKSGETEVDLMVEGMARQPFEFNAVKTNAGNSVLLERIRQSITVMSANSAKGEKVLLPTRRLKKGFREFAIAILWLHQMELPFEPGTVLPPISKRH